MGREEPPVVTLLTDFGSRDAYAAVMKGVILRSLPTARVVDVTHEVPPQDVRAAAFVLESACPYFPEGTVHLVVVDPGVGGPRRIIAAEAGEGRFLGPDNGVLSVALERVAREANEANEPHVVAVSDEAVRLARRRALPPRAIESTTFHGRDRFAPLAAELARGMALEELGSDVDDYVKLELPSPLPRGPGEVAGEAIYIDTFGNLVTNLRAGDLPSTDAGFEVAGRLVGGLVRAYVERERGELLAVVGSTGRVEISVREGSAAGVLGATVGTAVVARSPGKGSGR
ncbi:MAG: SAM hydrolase/SAM-dependent halogenase family protein [Planctomycetota bacterium]